MIAKKPVALSIISALVLSAFWIIAQIILSHIFEHPESQTSFFMRAAINIAFAVFAVVFFCIVHRVNGFKHIFTTKGLAIGLLALLPVSAFFLFGLMLNASGMSNADAENIRIFPAIAFIQITSAFIQNVLFRGLLITALFIRFSNTKNERIKSVFKAAALYLVIYIPLNIFINGGIELMQLINTFIVGAGFCTAYLYSRNILSLIIIQGVWQVLGSAINLFGTNGEPTVSPLLFIVLVVILISIIVVAIKLSKCAEPFILEEQKTKLEVKR